MILQPLIFSGNARKMGSASGIVKFIIITPAVTPDQQLRTRQLVTSGNVNTSRAKV
jgi:hypothetical protein